MSTHKDEIGQLFSTKFEKFEVPPSNEEWLQLSSRLRWSNFMKFSFSGFNVYYLAILLTITGVMVWVSLAGTGHSEIIPSIQDTAQIIKEDSAKRTSSMKTNTTDKIKLKDNRPISARDEDIISTPEELNFHQTGLDETDNAVPEPSATPIDSVKEIKPAIEPKVAKADTSNQNRIRRVKKVMVVRRDAVVVRDTVNVSKQRK